MRIDGIPGGPQPLDGGKKPSKTERSSGEVFVHNNSMIDFKTFITMVNSAVEADKNRQARVDHLKELVKSGKYSVDTANLAEKMMESMGG